MSERTKTAGERLIAFLASGLGLGYIPLAPGTFGTLLGIPICLLLFWGGWVVYASATVLLTAGSIWLAGRADRVFGTHDSRRVVVDEICGFLVAMAFVVPGVLTIGIGFILFRFFDITKPFPAGYIDRNLAGGWGVMLDDIAAGVYANVALRIVIAIVHLVRPEIL
jgi:phosphatidylglycerophosphatase A